MSRLRSERREVNDKARLVEALAASQAAQVATMSQPDAVATLRQHVRNTAAFYQLPYTFELRFLRTTSRLERFNRTLRTQFCKTNAFHSEQGLRYVVAQQIACFNAQSPLHRTQYITRETSTKPLGKLCDSPGT